MAIQILDKNIFSRIVDRVIPHDDLLIDYLYEIYEAAMDSIEELEKNNILSSQVFVNHQDLILYLCGELLYTVPVENKEVVHEFIKNEDIQASIASVLADKYITLSMFDYKESQLGNKYLPPISSIEIYLSFMNNILRSYDKNDPKYTIINDLLHKSVKISRSIVDLLTHGYETEAYSCWRTLHECECTLIVIAKYGQPVIDAYCRHLEYGLLFKKGHSDTKEEEELFQEMKDKMKVYNLKSKDIKKFIEYGWMYAIGDFGSNPEYKLNFRDGLQKLAGLSKLKERYEASSEIIHSTPMLIYSSKTYYYYVTLLSLYDSFFRLEKVFLSLFAKKVNESDMQKYLQMKNVYYSQLINIYKREANNFEKWQKILTKQI